MKILFLSDHLGHPEGRLHGASTYFLNVLPALSRVGEGAVTVCFLREAHPAADRLRAEGVNPIFLNRAKWDVRAAMDVVRLVRERKIELIHAAGMKGILVGRWAAQRTGARCVTHLHDANPVGPFMQWLQRRTARWNDHTICISQAVARFSSDSLGVPPDNVTVLHNPLPPNAHRTANPNDGAALREAQGLDGKFVLLVLGRMSPEKGHAALIEKGAAWLRDHPDTVFWFVGDGPERDRLARRVSPLAVGEQIKFAGHLEDIATVFNVADLLLVPSIKEGLSYVALEAMAAGCPVAALAVGGVPEIVVHEETGLLAPPGVIEDLLAQVDRLRADGALREKLIAAGRRFSATLSVDEHVEQLIGLYAAVVSQPEARKG